jgi:hypothetical protein
LGTVAVDGMKLGASALAQRRRAANSLARDSSNCEVLR